MAVADTTAFQKVDPCFLRTTEQCFYCGEKLAGSKFIFWNGCDERGIQIWMHPDCAKRFADQLNFDFKRSCQ